jgi:hypothetical protein
MEYPPISQEKDTTLVKINISVTNIDELEEIKNTFSVKIHIRLKWYDSRLTFYNLRGEMKRGNVVGIIERADLWIPRLVFINSLPEFHIENDLNSVVMVKKEGLPVSNENTDLQENECYSGSDNPIVYERYIDLNLRCNYEFSNYPFDQQFCGFQVFKGNLGSGHKSNFDRLYCNQNLL